MKENKKKVYLYTRVSTAMQIDGYSLEAQRCRMRAFAQFNDFEIVGEYEDAGKSGKSIEGRNEFNQMMEDIKTGKDKVSYVLVFKLSRFGRNAADVLSTLQTMHDFGVNLICVEDGIDSSKDAGKLMISVLSAVAEIERENIRVQTMEGRIQKAHEANADLFISIHADSSKNRSAKGLSIYTISEKASDKEAAALAERENKADILYGMDLADYQPEVGNILIDFAKKYAMDQSSVYADYIVKEMKSLVELVPNAHRFAGFVVLKSPNIPSVLLEMGYLSNRQEEKLMWKSSYRNKLSKALVQAVKTYFKNNPV